MKSITTVPNAPHLIGIEIVRNLFCEYTGNPTAERSTVSRWIKRRSIPFHGTNPLQRFFDRAHIISALQADFPQSPTFITVEDAFLMAGLPYPNARKRHVE